MRRMANRDKQVTDVEQAVLETSNPAAERTNLPAHDATLDLDEPLPSKNRFFQWTSRVERSFRLEARGIHRVKPNEQSPKTTLSFMQIVMMWFSINTASQNITLASIGLGVFELGFVDATLCATFGALVGTLPVAYTAGWGPWSGNRTLVSHNLVTSKCEADNLKICARFSFGWWPTKICVLLNLVVLIGYSMIGAVISGQILSAVSPNSSLTVQVGIVITAVLTWLVTTCGIKIFHQYERSDRLLLKFFLSNSLGMLGLLK